MGNRKKYCVLFVDDQKESTAALKVAMEKRDAECLHATNLNEAWNLLQTFLPHLLIVDVHLSEKESGLNWLKEVRESAFHAIPAMILTGAGDEQILREAAQIGITDFIVKPSDPQILVKKTTAILKRLAEEPPYRLTHVSDLHEAKLTMHCHIAAVSETGLCLESHLMNKFPLSVTEVQSPLFAQIPIEPIKKLTVLNFDRQSAASSLFPIRNYCQVNGWTETDFRKVRLWIRRNGLGRSF